MSDSRECPGIDSNKAGKANACANCPNKSYCLNNDKEKFFSECREIKLRLSRVKHKIIILSGKGGVGKSTFSALFSDYLSSINGNVVGIVDTDICGPSLPKIMGVEGAYMHKDINGWDPIYVRHNLTLMSSSFIIDDDDKALVLYGDKKSGFIMQFLRDIDWPFDMNYLVVDTPPGTSDEHLSTINYLKDIGIDGAVIITTPQELSLVDVKKQINFCKAAKLNVIGVVENMAYFKCPHCHGCSDIFPIDSVGGKGLCDEMGVRFLGSVPIDVDLARSCDEGRDFFDDYSNSPISTVLCAIFNDIINYCDN